MNQFTQEELKNIGALIQRADIKGQEALTTALLLQKIQGLLQPEEVKEDKKEE